MPWEHAAANRLGNRALNQDRWGVAVEGELALAAVADGMGGHPRGELAAEAAVTHLLARFRADPRAAAARPRAFLRDAVEGAHAAVVAAGRAARPPADARTTVVVCLARPDRAWWAHAGDSRLYLLRGGEVVARTRDHTYVATLEAEGLLDPREAAGHPLRNYVLESLGGSEPPRAELDESPLAPGDVLLLCTDGLWSAVPEGVIAAIGEAPELAAALEMAVAEAEAASFPRADNVTAVALRWRGPAPERGRAEEAAAEGAPDAAEDADDALARAVRTLREALAEHERGGG